MPICLTNLKKDDMLYIKKSFLNRVRSMQNRLTFLTVDDGGQKSFLQNIKELCSKNHIKSEFVPSEEFLKNPSVFQPSDPVVSLSTDVHFLENLTKILPGYRIVVTEKPKTDFANVSSVSYSITDYAMQLCRHLAEMGCSRAALFSFCHSSIYVEEHIGAYMEAAERYGIEIREEDIYWRDRCSFADCWARLQEHIKEYNAVICSNDINAVYLCKAAAEAGYLVPRDFSVSGRGDTLVGKLTRPTVTTGELDRQDFLRQLLNLCRYLQKEPSVRKMDVMVSQNLRVGESTDLGTNICEADYSLHYRQKSQDASEIGYRIFASMESFLTDCDSISLAIVYELIEGKTIQEIAARLFLEERTVAYRIRKMKEMLGVGTKKELVEAFLAFNIK